ncbi:MAG: D-2-hydroxyacid dehydrogenase [Chloroflexi bacterium]|nr:D-2-hydroxyacid dehydrogenase [Chloroflexota bacterium]
MKRRQIPCYNPRWTTSGGGLILSPDGTLNVLVAWWLEEKYRQQIASVDPRIRVLYGAAQIAAETRTPQRPFDTTVERAEPVTPVDLDSLLRETEVIYGLRFPKDLTERAPRLKWVQTSSAGIDTILGSSLWRSHVTITNASGIHVVPMREHVLGIMLLFARRFRLALAQQQQRYWKRYVPEELCGKTLGVVGLGRIGESVACLARAFGMSVVAVRRSATGRETSPVADKLYPPTGLLEMLGECDFVLVSVALTDETRKLIGERELKAMKPTAYIMNIARGQVIDEAALIEALKENWIAGAGLDVFDNEPLPPESELWTLPNVIITPHEAGVMPEYNTRALEVFLENLRRYLAGQPLINVVDRARGY